MLKVPNLDDQTFEDIMHEAIAQIAYVYPEWTDHNSHDPGITLLELFSWYKEMQQYHLNASTLQTLDMYLKLLGLYRNDIKPAQADICFYNIDKPFDIKQGDKIYGDDENSFEYNERKTIGQVVVDKIAIKTSDKIFDVTDFMQENHMNFDVFGEGDSIIYIKLEGLEKKDKELSMYIDVYDGYEVKRQPFFTDQVTGKKVVWQDCEDNSLDIIKDETYNFSQTGEVIIGIKNLIQSDPVGLGKGVWISARLDSVGCEEIPKICGISTCFANIIQQESLVYSNKYYTKTQSLEIKTEKDFFENRSCLVFGRDECGYFYIDDVEIKSDSIVIHSKTKLAFDVKSNILLVYYDEWLNEYITADGSGRGDFSWKLPVHSLHPNAPKIGVMGKHMTKNGERYLPWEYTMDINMATKYQRCYSYDYNKESLVFGDNIHGEVAPKGSDSLILTAFALVGNKDIHFASKRVKVAKDCYANVSISKSTKTTQRESVKQAKTKLSVMLANPCKAVTPLDYSYLAKKTPGLRVAKAKAIVDFDADNLMDVKSPNTVTLVVVPYSNEKYAKPDDDFLATVKQHMEKYRPICTWLKVRAPVYIPIDIYAKIMTENYTDKIDSEIKEAIDEAFMYKNDEWRLGDTISESDIVGAIGGVENVLGVFKVTLTTGNSRVARNNMGDIILPQNAQAILNNLNIITR